jgi:PAS domain S-box-containing protein
MDESLARWPKFGKGEPHTGFLSNRALDLIATCHAKPLASRLAVALFAVLAAIAIRATLLDALGIRFAYLTFYPAVAVAALLGGVAAGVLATIIAAVLAHLLISPLASVADLTGLAAFLVGSLIIVVMAEGARVSQVRLASSEQTPQNEQQMRYFVERVPAAIAMFDTSMRYLAASARWRNEFSIGDEVTGCSHDDVFFDAPDHWKEACRQALAGQGMRANEDSLTRLDGSTRWLRWEVQPWYSDADIVGGVTIFCEDLTEQKRTEAQLVQAQKMEVVGNLCGGVAHDFNNLLTVILGNAELLGEQVKPQQDSMRFVDSIARAAEHGADLTQQLLAFGRRQMLCPVEIDCSSLLDALHKLLRRTLREDIEVRIDFEPNLPPAFADPVQLESAVLGLALNAQDAMAVGGRLTITTRAVSFDGHDPDLHPDVLPGEYVSIAVSDNGEGIPGDVIGKVFEPFFTTKDVGKGSGLGLSMVYGFVKQSNGHVSIDSEPGLGTTVRMYLPQAATAALLWPGSTADELLPKGTETCSWSRMTPRSVPLSP